MGKNKRGKDPEPPPKRRRGVTGHGPFGLRRPPKRSDPAGDKHRGKPQQPDK